MCKTVNIEYKCDRCGQTVVRHAKPRFGLAFAGRYPKSFARIGKKPLCPDCQKEFFVDFMNAKKSKAQGV